MEYFVNSGVWGIWSRCLYRMIHKVILQNDIIILLFEEVQDLFKLFIIQSDEGHFGFEWRTKQVHRRHSVIK